MTTRSPAKPAFGHTAFAFITCLLATCSADFQSGTTKCSATKTCPDGFTCNPNGFCVTPGGSQGPDGGTPTGTGGTNVNPGTGGINVNPGTGGVRGTGGTTPTPDAGPPPSTMVPIKFCNDITRGMMDTNLEVVIDGTIRLPAKTGACSTALNQMCTGITPTNHTFVLMEGAMTLSTATLKVEPATENILYVGIENDMPVLKGASLKPEFKCSTYDFFADTGMMTPMPPAGMAKVKLCNNTLAAMPAMDVQMVLGALTLKAAPGMCSPAGGVACTAIPSGPTKIKVTYGATTVVDQTVMIDPNDEKIVQVNFTNGAPVLQVGDAPAGSTCMKYPNAN